MLSRAASVRTPEDVRGLFGSTLPQTNSQDRPALSNGQELAGSGALVFEGETVEAPGPITNIH